MLDIVLQFLLQGIRCEPDQLTVPMGLLVDKLLLRQECAKPESWPQADRDLIGFAFVERGSPIGDDELAPIHSLDQEGISAHFSQREIAYIWVIQVLQQLPRHIELFEWHRLESWYGPNLHL